MYILLEVANNNLNERIKNSSNKNTEKVPSDIITMFYIGAIISIGIDWLKNNKYTKDEIIKYLEILIPDEIY